MYEAVLLTTIWAVKQNNRRKQTKLIAGISKLIDFDLMSPYDNG